MVDKAFTDRLKKLKGDRSLAEFAALADASPQAAKKWMDGGNVTDAKLLKIAKGCGVSVHWLRYGDEPAPDGRTPAQKAATLSPTALEIATAFEKLSPVLQSSVRTMIFAMASAQSVAPWLAIGAPRADGYAAWEKAIEKAYLAEMKQLQLDLHS